MNQFFFQGEGGGWGGRIQSVVHENLIHIYVRFCTELVSKTRYMYLFYSQYIMHGETLESVDWNTHAMKLITKVNPTL